IKAEIWTGVGEKMPTPDGPPVGVTPLDELVTAVVGPVVPVDNSLVVVEDDDAPVDEVGPEVPVEETASCARNTCGLAATKISADKTTDNRLISRVARFEPRLERETRNRFVAIAASIVKLARLIVSAPVARPVLTTEGSAIERDGTYKSRSDKSTSGPIVVPHKKSIPLLQ